MTQEHREKMENLEQYRTLCQIYSRVCGWLVPRHSMNPGKQSERKDMKVYDLETSFKHEL